MILINMLKLAFISIITLYIFKLTNNKKSLLKKTYKKVYTFSEYHINKQYLFKNINENIDYYNYLNPSFQINKRILFVSEIIFLSFGTVLLAVKTKIFISSIIFIFFIGSFPIQYIYYKNNLFKTKFLKNLNTLIITLKNNVKNNNDIIYAIKKTTTNKMLKIYFIEFVNAINNGVSVLEAFEYVKGLYNIKEFSNIITIFQSCYIYGGNYYNILEKAEKQLKNYNKINYEFMKKNTDMISTLVIMSMINIYIIITFVISNQKYIDLFLNTIIGKVIIDINMFLFIYIYFVISKANKREELNGFK